MAEIDSLQVKIEVDSKQAVDGVQQLVSTLEKLKKATDSVKATKTVNAINKIADAVKKMPKMTKVATLSELSKALSSIPSNIKFPSNMAGQLDKLNASLGKISQTNINKLQQIGTAFSTITANNKAKIPSLNVREKSTRNRTGYKRHDVVKELLNAGAVLHMIQSGTDVLHGFINKSMEYTEDLNLFTASMGEYAKSASDYADKVSRVMGIDPAQWLRAQGIFQTITEGFGVASDRALIMSKNLTQLGYDLSSFANISVELAMDKLTSGISGELEPLRKLGYDLSMARLKAEALALGINKTFNEMTQAEKAQLRYVAILKQVTVAQGDMARTLDTPANQMRIFSATVTQAGRAIGNILIPMLNAILPYAIAAMKIIRALADTIASLFGFKLPKVDYSGVTKGAKAMGGLADNAGKAGGKLKGASDEAKKLKNNLLGIDELNIIPQQDTPKGGGGAGGGGGGDLGLGDGFDFKLPEYDFLKGLTDGKVSKALDNIKNSAKKLAPVLGALGMAFAGVKLLDFIAGLLGVKSLLPALGLASWASIAGGMLLFLGGAILYASGAVDAIMNGMNWKNLVKMLAGMAGMISGIYLVMKPLSSTLAPMVAGLTAVATGFTLLWISLRDMREHGVNAINILGGSAGLIALVGGLVVAMKSFPIVIAGFNISPIIAPLAGFLGALQLVKSALFDMSQNGMTFENTALLIVAGVTAVTTAVWALTAALAVNPIFMAVTAVAMIAGLALAFTGLNEEMRKAGEESYKNSDHFKAMEQSIKESEDRMKTATDATDSLKKSLSELSSVQMDGNIAQQLVDDIMTLNDKTVLTSEEIATMKWKAEQLNEITNGKVNIEFDETTNRVKQTREEVEKLIEAYKQESETKALQEIYTEALKAQYQAQMDYNNEIKKAKDYNADLVKVREELSTINKSDRNHYFEVLAKEKEITVARDRAVESAKAQVEAIKESQTAITTVGDKITDVMLNGSSATDGLTKSVQNMQTEVDKVATGMTENGKNIAEGLQKGIDENLNGGKTKSIWQTMLEGFQRICGIHSPSRVFMGYGNNISEGLILGISDSSVDPTEAIKALATKVCTKFTEIANLDKFKTFATDTITGFKKGIEEGYTNAQSAVSTWVQGIKSWFTDSEGINATTFGTFASNVITGFKEKISTHHTDSKSSILSWATGVKDWFVKDGGASKETFGGYAKDVVDGFKDKIESVKSTVKDKMVSLANYVKENFKNPNGVSLKSTFESIGHDVMEGFKAGLEKAKRVVGDAVDTVTSFVTRKAKKGLEVNSPSRVFKRIGYSVTEGLALGISSTTPDVLKTIDVLTSEMGKADPTVSYTVDTSNVKMNDDLSFMGVQNPTVTKQTEVAVGGFKEGMAEFYKEYLEPTMREMAGDVKRQANKKEETIVQIGNRTVHDVVTEQRNANGYSFVTER